MPDRTIIQRLIGCLALFALIVALWPDVSARHAQTTTDHSVHHAAIGSANSDSAVPVPFDVLLCKQECLGLATVVLSAPDAGYLVQPRTLRFAERALRRLSEATIAPYHPPEFRA